MENRRLTLVSLPAGQAACRRSQPKVKAVTGVTFAPKVIQEGERGDN